MLLQNGVNPVVNKNLQNGLSNAKNAHEEIYEKKGDEPHGRGQVGSIGHKLGNSMRHKEYR